MSPTKKRTPIPPSDNTEPKKTDAPEVPEKRKGGAIKMGFLPPDHRIFKMGHLISVRRRRDPGEK